MINFGLTSEQALFQRTARDFLRRQAPLERVREAERSDLGFDPALYHAMAGLGWTGLLIPQDYGGTPQADGDWVTLALLYEEMGRALCVSPHFPSAVVAGQALARWASPQARRAWLPAIVAREKVLTWVAHEPETQSAVQASAKGPQCTVDGAHAAVPLGHAADAYVVSASASGDDVLCLVERGAPGVATMPLSTVGGLRLAAVEFHGAPGTVLARGTSIQQEWARLLLHCRLMLAAEMVGGARAALDMAVEYAKHRVAFGRPIGSFQALQHKMANMALAVEGAHAAVFYAATLLSQGKPADAAAAVAQLQASEAYRLAATEGVQVFGGIGVMDESAISVHFRRAKALELLLGPLDTLHEQIARVLEQPQQREAALTLLR